MWGFYFWAKELLDKEGGEYDPRRAVGLLMESAYRGNTVAEYRLGKMFLLGEEVRKNVDVALRWLEEAAKDKNEYAEYLLGKIYLYDHEIGRDEERAMAYLNAAALHGNEYAARLLEQIKTDRKQFSDEATRRGVCRLFQTLASLLQSRSEEQNGKRILTDKKLRRRIGEKR